MATKKSAKRSAAKIGKKPATRPGKRRASTSTKKAKSSAKKSSPKSAKSTSRVKPMFDRVAFTLFEIEDSKRARAFYEGILGFKRGLASAEGTWTEYDLPGGGCLALFRHPAGTFTPSGGASLAFEVADLDALNVRLQAAGVRYMGDVVRGPHCRMSNILDSEGNRIILHQLDHDPRYPHGAH